MKNLFLTMVIAGITAFSAQAQTYFAGGKIGFDYSDGKSSYGSSSSNRPSNVSFEFSPMLGYYLSDKLGAGVKITLGMGATNNRAEYEQTKNNSFDWGFSPFLRYTLLTRGDFSVLAEGGVGVFGSTSKSTYGSDSNKGPRQFGFDIGVMPVLSFSLTPMVSIEASSNLAWFGFTVESEKRGSGDSQSKETGTSFGFGVDSNNFFRSPYQLGLIFKF